MKFPPWETRRFIDQFRWFEAMLFGVRWAAGLICRAMHLIREPACSAVLTATLDDSASLRIAPHFSRLPVSGQPLMYSTRISRQQQEEDI